MNNSDTDKQEETYKMTDCSAGVLQHNSELVLLNGKLQYDVAAGLANQMLSSNQLNSNAWNSFNLTVAQDNHTLRHMVAMNNLTSDQTGATENQQSVTPVRQATGDAIVGGVGVSAEQVAANVADIATSLVPVIASSLATALSQSLAAILPSLIQSVGSASQKSGS